MSESATRTVKAVLATILGGALLAAPLVGVATSASASVDGTGVIINEAYLKGGSANAPFNKKFVELYNPGDAPVSLDGWSLQYRSASASAAANGVGALTGSIPADGYYLAAINGNGTTGAALPEADVDLGSALNPSGTNGTLFLASTTTALTPATGSVVGAENIVDLVGYGTSNTFEGGVATVDGANGVPNSLNRTGFADTDVNSADFVSSADVTPQSSGQGETPEPTPTPTGTPEPTTPPADPTEYTIAELQGTGASSPFATSDKPVVSTSGVVTAVYPTGGFNGYVIQTPGTGSQVTGRTASDAIYVYSASTVASVAIGDHVKLTGTVTEFQGLTEFEVTSAAGLTKLDTPAEAVTPLALTLPLDDAARETMESMLVAPQGDFTVTNNYSTNQYAEIGLAAGDTPLVTPTETARPDSAEYTAAVASNAARAVTLDDGASINFLPNGGGAAQNIPLPYLTENPDIVVGSKATFTAPLIFDFRNSAWKFQPTTQYAVGGTAPATFTGEQDVAPAEVGGDIQIAGFNVLNYFTTTGDQLTGCTYYVDRDKDPVTVNRGCDARGAAEAEDLARQQAKIVAAINGLGAEVVSLEEIENSAKFGEDRDSALSTLVTALNAALGSEEWAFVPSPAADALPPLAQQDVIRTAFIYKKAAVEPVGASRVLIDPAFSNARQPLAQEFAPVGATGGEFIAIVNHFKSKGDSTPPATGDNANGVQGAFNGDRTRQAAALLSFSSSLQTELGTTDVFLIGDFNAYSKEDPAVALTDAGYIDQGAKSGKYSYSFGGTSGSLDHVFASPSADAKVTGVDIWNINSGETIAKEYSRYNYNATNFYDESVFRSSDHDPVVLGYNPVAGPVELNLIDINDFHGRIDANTVKFAGTIEQLKAQSPNSMFISSGDNVGASLFASSVQQDQPTIDVLNALSLKTSAVGNHEFDQGYADLTDRIIGADDARNAKWAYLGANVYEKGTTTPALPEYAIEQVGGLRVGVIGAITQETPSLVSPGGISGLDFGDPVDAVNRVAAQLTDGDESNGEADVLIASYHEGAGAGLVEGATLEQELAQGGAFAKIVNDTDAKVAAIFTGHTHKQYAWDGPIKGTDKTRPVLQTGNYGENIGQVKLSIDPETHELVSYTATNVKRLASATGATPAETAALSAALDAQLVNTYPAVAEVKTITDAALAYAAEIGNQPKGSVTADITSANTGGSYVDGVYVGGSRDDRASESTLGDLVADSLVSSLSSADRGGAEIGVVNPGGLRAELLFKGDTTSNPANTDGTITYAEANAVLPFVNNLWTTSLTGAQFKTVLEQQWQTNPDGTVPSRPYLQLGLSKNVTYTFDATAARGSHITGIWINGEPIDPAASYRIGSFNFLLQGGDNFREFTSGTNTRDSGLVDRDAWISYLESNPGLTPDFARQAVQVSGVTAGDVELGADVSATVSGLNLTSLGSPENTSLTATWTGSAATFASIPVTNGSATVSVEVPVDAYKNSELVLTASPSGTVVRIPVTVSNGLPNPPEVDRIAGADRFEVSVNLSKDGFPDGADSVYVTSGEVFPDALAAAPAATVDSGPILLTQNGVLPQAVRDEIVRLGAKNIVIVGGPATVSTAVETELKTLGTVTRIGGADRYEVSRNVAKAAYPDGAPYAVLATGTSFADALSAGAAVAGEAPVILVNGGQSKLDAATKALLTDLGVDKLVIVGGEASVSAGILADANTIAPTERLGGKDRYEASRNINAYFFDTADRVLLTTGLTFTDALSASAYAPRIDAPLFTIPGGCVPQETRDQITDLGATRVTVIGGEASVTKSVDDLAVCTR
ncbi:ExeM/NucH family extracellular endonuclease [Herbiconiux liangxiaofengii]|uniref:ExeM/NucH family extracellular endonuclease n=1 Tax=Herbiconiux liangxiaofengii TaxID=3342795 RepID=UPI0035B739D8